MPRRIYTAADIRIWKECGESRIELAAGDIVTPEGRDLANVLGVALTRTHADSNGTPISTSTSLTPVAESQELGFRETQVRVQRGMGIDLQPFAFDVKRPDMNIRASDVVTDRDGSPMGAGFMSFRQGSFPWTLNYDEIDYVIEGELEIRVGDKSYVGQAGDIIFIPRGTSILFCTASYARFLYVTYPANWTAQ